MDGSTGLRQILLCCSCALAPALAVSACANSPRIEERSEFQQDTEIWQRQSDRWLSDFQAIAGEFPRTIPQLRPGSAFLRHRDALAQHLRDLAQPGEDHGERARRHAQLAKRHEELQRAHANMIALVQNRRKTPTDRPQPEFAEDYPQN